MRGQGLVLVVAVLAACSRSPQEPPRAQEPPAVTELVWRTWSGKPSPGCPMKLTFYEMNHTLDGLFPDGHLSASYIVDGSTLTITDPTWSGAPKCRKMIAEWLIAPLPFTVATMRLKLGKVPFRTDMPAVGTVAASLVGLSEHFAQRVVEGNGVEFLVIRRDGVDLPRLLDLRLDRIDAQIDEGVVTKASVG